MGAGAPWPGDTSTPGGAQQPGGPVGNGGAPWPGDAATTGGVPQPGGKGHPGGPGAANGGAPWPGDAPAAGGGVPQPGGKGRPRGAKGGAVPNAGTTQQMSMPTVGPTIGGVPAGGAAFATGRTDTPRQGVPMVPPPGPQAGAPQGGGAQAGAPQGGGAGKGKKRGPKGSASPSASAPVGAPGGPVPKPAAGQGAKAPADAGAPRVAVPKPKGAVPPPPAPSGTGVPKPPAPAAKSAPKPAAKAAPKKKGRSKVVLLAGGLIGLVAAAYAAGLLLDHADVPNGTTVLGVDIGGKSKDEAVKKLDSALGDRATAPLKLSIGGKPAALKPSVAGLSIDTQATVRDASGRDYNPVTVLGSLIGNTHAAEPALSVDEEKVAAALKSLAGESGSATDGTIKFEPGKAVAVYGKPYEGVDVDKSVKAIAQAYRDRAATGQDKPVELTTSSQQPKVPNAEVDRMMQDFAKPAMSGLVTVQTDPAHSIQFGPELSLPKILSVKEVGGKLVESYDLEELKKLYGKKFDGVLIQRGDGTKKPVTPQDVAGALGKALRGKTPAERVGTIMQTG
ncbi:hypothetical protein EKH77_20935 [Streptomyces luteoverticillatus]|uniref:Peptidoglycan binding domain-containing protein n=2 Tax=Streptomyces luteoverticillatus TaxID=66425 RepID=A0A3Q9G0M5_STRLT|nr:hypothetical protein EKH77_20935 [Streptomyces luteoverticillatus]